MTRTHLSISMVSLPTTRGTTPLRNSLMSHRQDALVEALAMLEVTARMQLRPT